MIPQARANRQSFYPSHHTVASFTQIVAPSVVKHALTLFHSDSFTNASSIFYLSLRTGPKAKPISPAHACTWLRPQPFATGYYGGGTITSDTTFGPLRIFVAVPVAGFTTLPLWLPNHSPMLSPTTPLDSCAPQGHGAYYVPVY